MRKPTPVHVHEINAAVLRSRHRPLEIEPLDMEGPRDDEVLVRIVATGICHTDISFCDTWEVTDEPVVLGHEGAGVVEEVGHKVRGVKPGDHVVLSYQSCGRCRPCRSGHPAGCRRFWDANFGFRRLDGSNALQHSGAAGHFFGQSSFATLALATERNIVLVPEDLSLETLAPLGCGMQTGAGTVMNSLDVPEGASIAVFGTGSVGLAAVMAARIRGAGTVIGVDINPMRLKLACELGATHAIDSRKQDAAQGIARITGSGVDFVVETTDDPSMLQAAVEVLNAHGKAAFLTGAAAPEGLPEGRKALSVIQGDAVPQVFIPKLIEFFRQGLFPFDRLVKLYDFHDINRAIEDSRHGDTIKPVLRVGGA